MTRNYDFWKKQSVPHVNGYFPFGNIARSFLMRRTIGEDFHDIYRKFPDEPAIGFFKFDTPVLMITDPELIKTVLVKEFHRFHDNDNNVHTKLDPILGINSFFLKGGGWKVARSIVTPALTIGKIKAMVPQFAEECQSMIQYLMAQKGSLIEAKGMVSYYTMDTAAATGFSLKWNSFFDAHSGFRRLQLGEVFGTSWYSNLSVLCSSYSLKLGDYLGLRVTPTDVTGFFVNMVKQITKMRLDNGVRRSDFIQQLIDSDIGSNYAGVPDYVYIEMAAHCMTFFMDYFETSGLLFSFCLFELAHKPEVQDKLRKEILSIGENIEDFDYDKLNSLTYLDMVISETLRLHPPLPTFTRICTYPTTLKVNGKAIRVDIGTPIAIPVYSIHTDEKHYPQPLEFNPENFDKENVEKRHKFTFLGWGEGPRICIGVRVASTQVKMGLIAVLLNFKVLPKETKRITPKLNPMSSFLHTPKDGLWLKFIPIK